MARRSRAWPQNRGTIWAASLGGALEPLPSSFVALTVLHVAFFVAQQVLQQHTQLRVDNVPSLRNTFLVHQLDNFFEVQGQLIISVGYRHSHLHHNSYCHVTAKSSQSTSKPSDASLVRVPAFIHLHVPYHLS